MPTTVSPLPEHARLLHIGPHKTGSTALQVSLHRAREAIARHGVHYGGTGRRPRRAGWALGLEGKPAGSVRPPRRHWDALVSEVTSAPGRVVVSNEDFGRATPQQVAQIVEQLGGDEVHVLAAARRLDRYLPSQWQERVKAGTTAAYDDWLRDVLDRTSPDPSWERHNVWHSHDLSQLVSRWTDVVGPERFTLVILDGTSGDVLHRTVERLTGLPADTLELHPDQSNRSLGLAEVELVRMVHDRLKSAGWDRPSRRRAVRPVLGAIQEMPTHERVTPALPEWALDDLRSAARRDVKTLERAAVHVIGDQQSLLIPDDVGVGHRAAPDATVATDVAAASVIAALHADRPSGEATD